METPAKDNKRQTDYTIGYGCPPKEHRFKPGQSGNLRGRPKGSKNSPTTLIGQKRINAFILDAANKEISLRENGERVTMATVQAILLAINSKAIKGSVGAQKLSMDLVRSAAFVAQRDKDAYLEALISYKMNWEKEFRKCDQDGLERPDIIPHPDDIILDFKNGDAWIDGPITPKQRIDVKNSKKQIVDFEASICEQLKLKKEHPEFTDTINEEIKFLKKTINILEGALPDWHKRYD